MPPGEARDGRNVCRRAFVKTIAATAAIAGLRSQRTAAEERTMQKGEPLVGIHIAAHSFYDEGIDYCLDMLRETAGVNALFVSSNYYYGAMVRPKEVMGDHGVPIRDNKDRKLSRIYFKFDDRRYEATSLRHNPPDGGAEYAGREIFADLAEPARKRGIRLYERMYEPGSALKQWIRNGEKVVATDMHGKPDGNSRPCWNHPEFRAWTVAAISDLFKTYPLDGIQYGAERVGPLSQLLYSGRVPTCFCEHCAKRAAARGLEMALVREGFEQLYACLQARKKNEPRPVDGVFATVLRTVIQYPELLVWEREQLAANEEIHKAIFNAVRAINPKARVGRHVDHAQSSWDIVYRAAMPPATMARTCDFIKPILYHEILGPRIRNWVLEGLCKGVLSDLSMAQALEFFYAVMGHDPATEPKLDELNEKGFSPEYVYRETRRLVDGAQGKCAIYAGIGVDIPKGGGWGSKACASNPDSLAQATKRSLEAGATGIVICREYEENRIESLRAVGRAVRDAVKAGR